jgi:hypothetical protein
MVGYYLIIITTPDNVWRFSAIIANPMNFKTIIDIILGFYVITRSAVDTVGAKNPDLMAAAFHLLGKVIGIDFSTGEIMWRNL